VDQLLILPFDTATVGDVLMKKYVTRLVVDDNLFRREADLSSFPVPGIEIHFPVADRAVLFQDASHCLASFRGDQLQIQRGVSDRLFAGVAID